jgi:hypothetical protein
MSRIEWSLLRELLRDLLGGTDALPGLGGFIGALGLAPGGGQPDGL